MRPTPLRPLATLILLLLPALLRAEPAPGRLIEAWGGRALHEEARLEPAGGGPATPDFDPGTRSIAGVRLSSVAPGETWGVLVEVGAQSTRAATVDLDLLTGDFGLIWDPWRQGGDGWRRLQPHLMAGVVFASADGSGEGNAGARAGTLLTRAISSLSAPGLAAGAGVRVPLTARVALLAEVQLRYLGLVQDADWRTTTALDPAGQGTLAGAYATLGLAWK